MKPAAFDYARPDSLDEALALMADTTRDVAALAGGQSLVPMMNFRLAVPGLLVDLGGLAALRGIAEVPGANGDTGDTRDTGAPGALRIGAMTRYADLAAFPALEARLPLLARALPHVAHSAIRNRGTIGGSVALADPAAELPAVLTALGASIELASQTGRRALPADGFFTGHYDTRRAPGELVTAITVPMAQAGQRFGFYEVTRRHGDYAMAGVAIAQQQDLRIVFFSVADRPVRARAAEAILAADPGALEAACAALGEIAFTADLNGGTEMKQHLAGVVLRRAWAEAPS